MAHVLHLMMSDNAHPELWPEDWKSARATCRAVTPGQKPPQYSVVISKLMLKRLQTAGCMLSASQTIEDFILAQMNHKKILEQYFYVTQKLATTLWGVLRNLLEDQAHRYAQALHAPLTARRQYGPGLRMWALLQEHAAFMIGVVPPVMPDRLADMEFWYTIAERATIIASFIRKGTETLKRAHADVAWCAIMTALGQITDSSQGRA